MDILENTALSLGKKIRQKEISVREAVKASLDQIDRQEPKIHAFLDVDEKKVYARVKEVEEGIKAGRYRRAHCSQRQHLHEGSENHLRFKDSWKLRSALQCLCCRKAQRGRHDRHWKNKHG